MLSKLRTRLDLAGSNLMAPTLSAGNTQALLVIAAWFGLLTGVLEGAIFLALQMTGSLMYVSTEIVWIAPLFDLLWFSIVRCSCFW